MFSILLEACNGNTDASYHKSHVKKRFSRVILINRFVLLKVYKLSIFIICFIYKKLTTLIFIASVMTYFHFHYGVQRM